MSVLLCGQGLSLTLGRREVLCDTRLSLVHGEMVALVGPNGSGKSTLLRTMAGLLRPTAGEIILDGRPFAEVPPAERAGLMSYLPQDTRVFWDFTVEDVIELGAGARTRCFWPTARRNGLPPALVEAFELQPLAGRILNRLSGGERARVMLAAAVASGPRVLLADEPLASLDICHQLSLMERLRALRSRCASIVVLHDLNLAARFADRIVVMDEGRTVLDGPPSDVLNSRLLDRVFRVSFRRLGRERSLTLLPEGEVSRSEAATRDDAVGMAACPSWGCRSGCL